MKCKSILVFVEEVWTVIKKIFPHRPNIYCLMDCVKGPIKWMNECNIKEAWIVGIGVMKKRVDWLSWASIEVPNSSYSTRTVGSTNARTARASSVCIGSKTTQRGFAT